MLGLGKGWHAAVALNIARTSIVSRQTVNDVAIKHGQHLRQIARAAGDLDVGVFVIGRVNPEILRRAGHDLG